MASNAVVTGPTAERVARNIERLRKARQLKQKDLSDLLEKAGRPTLPTVISKIERGERRIDVDDLVAFALALNVSPITLLLPPTWSDEPTELTAETQVRSQTAWRWVMGQGPAVDWWPGDGVSVAEPGADPAIAAEAYEREQEYDRKREEYVALALPPGLRRSANNPLVRITQQLEELVEDIVGPRGDRDDRARWSRMALRRVEQIRLNLEEVAEAMAGEDALEQFKRQNPGVISHSRGGAAGDSRDNPRGE
ncbi:helix-turn-helix domain-containing protein [Streptomyces sp. NPDC001118]